MHTAVAVVAEVRQVHRRFLVNNGERYSCYVENRWLVMWLARELGSPWWHAAYYLGFDHTTIIHGWRRVEGRRTTDPEYTALCAHLLERAREYSVGRAAMARQIATAAATSEATADNSVHRSTAS